MYWLLITCPLAACLHLLTQQTSTEYWALARAAAIIKAQTKCYGHPKASEKKRGYGVLGERKDCINFPLSTVFCTSSCNLSDSSRTPTWQGRDCCWRREGSQWWSNLPKVINHKTTCQAAKEGVSAEELKWAEKLMLDLKVSDEASPSNLTDFNPQPQFPPLGLSCSPTSQFQGLTHHRNQFHTIGIFLPYHHPITAPQPPGHESF